jgi:hypothetical protein
MRDRPIAGVLAAIAAAMFVAAFAGAAVTRPETAPVAQDTGPSAPAAATEETTLAAIAAPSLSPVAALPTLHLPAHRKPAKKKTAPARVRTAPRVSTPPPPVATPVPTATAPRVSTPPVTPPVRNTTAPKRKAPTKTFDTSG